MDGTGDRLSRIDAVQWTGEASTALRTSFGAEPPKWTQAAEVLANGGQALADYGDVLAWGQGQAQRAIELYTQAQAATRDAAARYDTRVQFGTPVGPFADPGAGAAQEAQAVLDHARGKVEQAGTDAADALGFEPDGSGGYKKKLGDKSFGTDKDRQKRRRWDPEKKKWEEEDPGGWQRTKGGRTYRGEWGSQSDGLFTDMVGDKLKELGINLPSKTWSTDGHVELAGATAEGGFDTGLLSGHGKVSGSLLGAGGEVHAGIDPLGVTAGASGEAYLGKGSASGEVRLGRHAGGAGDATGLVGAQGDAEGRVGLLGGQGNADVFVGGKVTGDASAEVAGVTAGAHSGAEVGFGAGASGQFGMGNDGKFHIGGSVNLAFGLGGSVGLDVSVDPGEVAHTVGDVAKAGWHGAENAGKNLVNSAAHGFGLW
jgi:hypothetical protein